MSARWNRAGRLRAAEVARWEARWAAFFEHAMRPLPGSCLDVIAGWDDEADNAPVAAALEEAAGAAGLDVDVWNEWFCRSQDAMPQRDDDDRLAVDLRLWPHLIPAPPEEPPDAFAGALACAGTPHGPSEPTLRAAALMALWLASARAVRDARADAATGAPGRGGRALP